tara:strand:- start:724 stop:1332 length:609 start_codon:yes stop_codon:yes gene_type:complete
MAKRCPPGVICIENVTIIFVLMIVGFVVLFLNIRNQKQSGIRERVVIKEQGNPGIHSHQHNLPTNIQNDILMDPYEAPLKDERVYPRNSSDPRGIPINTPTQSVDTNYRQVGILTRMNGDGENILPLMGRPLFTNRDKWNFYTMTDKNHMIKLPITHKGRSCTNEYGCDNMYNGDTVYVEGYNDAFKVTMYDNQVMRYIPYL